LVLGEGVKNRTEPNFGNPTQSVATETQKTMVMYCQATMSLLWRDAGVDEEEERSSMLVTPWHIP
jgi:hypothetical protein